MSGIKTKVTKASVNDFIRSVKDEAKQKDAMTLLSLFKQVTKEKPKMWGNSMIGFGTYHYKSERSSQEGDWPLIAFSPRKQNLTVYVMPGFTGLEKELKKLGKHKTSVGCLYINKLSDVDRNMLEAIIKKSYLTMKKKYAR